MWASYQELCQSYEASAGLIARRILELRPLSSDSDVLQRITLLQSEYNDLAAAILRLKAFGQAPGKNI